MQLFSYHKLGVEIMYKSISISCLGALAMLVTAGPAFVICTDPQAAQAQTRGMERRQDRRDTRQDARAEKHECTASGQSSRAGCRQEKRDTKQSGRQDRMGQP